MAWSAVAYKPEVVEMGGARIVDDAYKGDGSTDITSGDIIRINTSGQVVPVDATGDLSDGVHGLALKDYDASVEGAIFIPVLLFANDTILQAQLNSASAPATTDIGDTRNLEVSSDIHCVSTTSDAEDTIMITDIWTNDYWYLPNDNEAGAYGLVRFRVLQAALDNSAA